MKERHGGRRERYPLSFCFNFNVILTLVQDSDLFFSLGQKSEAEIKYIEKESEYFARCVKAEEETEELGKDNKKLHNQMNELKYQLAKVKVEGEKVKEERDRLRETVESLKKELAAQKGASK